MSFGQISRRRLLTAGGATAGLATLPDNVAGHTERLKITRVEQFRVAVPMQDDIIYSHEFVETPDFSMVPKYILKVHTDSGIVGVGESTRGADGAAMHRNAKFVEGKNILDFNLTRLDLPETTGYRTFEGAFYDIVGKAVGWPVYRLLGGLAQRKVLVGYWCGRKNATDMRRVAERAKAGRFTSIKMKCKLGDPVVESVEAIAEVAPGVKVIVDPNARFRTYKDTLPIAKALDRIGNMLVLEDPFDKRDLTGYRELRKQIKTPLALHLGNPKAMIEAIGADACEVFNTGGDPSMASFLSNCYIAQAVGFPVWHGSSHDMGIWDAMYLHSCAAAPNCTLPSDILSYQRVDDLIVEPIKIVESYAIVSDKPGLGIELDEDAVRRYQVEG